MTEVTTDTTDRNDRPDDTPNTCKQQKTILENDLSSQEKS